MSRAARGAACALACCACHQVYCGGMQSNPYATLAGDPDAQVPFRVIAERAVPDHDDVLATFTYEAQYGKGGIDFEKNEIVRITARTGPGARVESVRREEDVLAIVVDARRCPAGVPAATYQFDVVVPLDPRMPELYVDRGPACREEAH